MEGEANRSVFPERLRRLREKKRVSRYVLSELCGLDPDTVRRYENGDAKPSADSLASLADYLDVTMDYLYGASDKPKYN